MCHANIEEFKRIITKIYEKTLTNNSGKVADYIPQLAQVNPDLYGISFCSVNGEIFNIGDTDNEFCLQSCCKPLNYCLARNLSTNNNKDFTSKLR